MHAEVCSDSRERQSACIELGGSDDRVVAKFPDNASSRNPLGIEVVDDRSSVDAVSDGEHVNR